VAAILEQRLNGDRLLGLKLIRLFRDDSPAKLAGLEKALAGGNLEEARRLAHTLSGSAAVIGLQEMHLALRELEGCCRYDQQAEAGETFSAIKQIYTGLEEDLQQTIDLWSEKPPPATGESAETGLFTDIDRTDDQLPT
jgi:HPt (histidine-containing phosphotransfer) domain-containing protein